jgi:hypothetical protein
MKFTELFNEGLPPDALALLTNLRQRMAEPVTPEPPNPEPAVEKPKTYQELKQQLEQLDKLLVLKKQIMTMVDRIERTPYGMDRNLAADIEMEDLYPVPETPEEYREVLKKYQDDLTKLKDYLARKRNLYKR